MTACHEVFLILRKFLPIGILLFVALAVFSPLLFAGRTMYPTDITNELFLPYSSDKASPQVQVTAVSDYVLYYYPARNFQASAFRAGQLNLWNPFVYGGQPAFASAGSVVAFDPFNVVLLWLDVGTALAWRSFLQVFACMIFMYLYLRSLGLGSMSGLVGSIGFGLNSMFWANIFDWSIAGMLWLPLICLLLDWAITHSKLAGGFLAGIVWGIALLASPLQVYLYLCISVSMLFSLQWLCVDRSWVGLKRYITYGVVSASVAVGISAVQLLPALELLQNSTRLESGAMAASAKHVRSLTEMILATLGLSSFVFPNLAGRLKESLMITSIWGGETHWQGFFGIVPFTLAITGAFASRDRRRIPFIVLGLIVLVAVLYTPLMLVLYERFLVVYIFCASVLATFGCDAIAKHQVRTQQARWALWLLGVFFGCVTVAIVVFNGVMAIAGKYVVDLVESRVQNSLGLTYLGSNSTALYLEKARSYLSDLTFASLQTIVPLIIAWTGMLVVILAIRTRLREKYFLIIVVTLTAIDLVFMTMTHVPYVELKRYPFSPTSAAIDLIKSDPSLFRVKSVETPGGPPIFPRGTIASYGIQSADGYDNLLPPNIGQLIRFDIGVCGVQTCVAPFGTDIANVKYLIAGPNTVLVPTKRFDLLYDQEVRVYRDRTVLPRAFFANQYEIVSDVSAAMQRLGSSDFDAKRTVILDRKPMNQTNTGDGKGNVRITSYTPLQTEIIVESPSGGILVVSDTFYPGWKATIDGRSVPVMRANGVMRAVEMGPGKHTVRFRFEPDSFQKGVFVSIVTLVLAVLGAGISSWRGSQRRVRRKITGLALHQGSSQ